MKHMIALALALLIIGCASKPSPFDPSRVKELQPGVSTLADARQKLGAPSAQTNYPDGSKLFAWQPAGGEIQARLLFDGAGRMIRVMPAGPAHAPPVHAATPPEAPPANNHASLGISGSKVSPELATELKLGEPNGVVVIVLNPGGIADHAGLRRDDVILSFNGAKITDQASLSRAINAAPLGQTLPVIVWRGGKEVALSIQF